MPPNVLCEIWLHQKFLSTIRTNVKFIFVTIFVSIQLFAVQKFLITETAFVVHFICENFNFSLIILTVDSSFLTLTAMFSLMFSQTNFSNEHSIAIFTHETILGVRFFVIPQMRLCYEFFVTLSASERLQFLLIAVKMIFSIVSTFKTFITYFACIQNRLPIFIASHGNVRKWSFRLCILVSQIDVRWKQHILDHFDSLIVVDRQLIPVQTDRAPAFFCNKTFATLSMAAGLDNHSILGRRINRFNTNRTLKLHIAGTHLFELTTISSSFYRRMRLKTLLIFVSRQLLLWWKLTVLNLTFTMIWHLNKNLCCFAQLELDISKRKKQRRRSFLAENYFVCFPFACKHRVNYKNRNIDWLESNKDGIGGTIWQWQVQ